MMSPTGSARNARQILVVEDDSIVRLLIAEVLRDEGYAVMEAADGAEAVAMLEQSQESGPIALVVLDMHLPHLDGLAVLQRIADQSLHVPVIAMSAMVPALTAARARGARAAILKPFELDRLLEAVAQGCSAAAG